MHKVTVELPQLGENVSNADVVAVLVTVGDEVREQQPLIEVETDKAAVEVPSPWSGRVLEVSVESGASVREGDSIVVLELLGPMSAEPTASEQSATQASTAALTTSQDHELDEAKAELPRPVAAAEPAQGPMGASDEQAAAASAPALASGESGGKDVLTEDQVTTRLPAAIAEAAPGTVIDKGSDGTPGTAKAAPIGEELGSREQGPAFSSSVAAAPTVRRFAREIGVDISEVPGSGPRGRVSIEDVKTLARRRLRQSTSDRLAVVRTRLPDMSRWGSIHTEPMSKVRRLTAEQMARSWSEVPQVTHHDHADITQLEEVKARYRQRVEAAGGRLTITAILVKVVSTALRVFPKLGASIDTANDAVVFKSYVHMGVAVDTERGLLVPVIRGSDTKSVTEISRELDDLASRARGRRLTPDEMQGASFTISNLGGIGGTAFSPIVSWPQVAILGVSRARLEPLWNEGSFQPRLRLPLSLSYDHRLIDGADAARFLRWIVEALEQPLLLVLEG